MLAFAWHELAYATSGVSAPTGSRKVRWMDMYIWCSEALRIARPIEM